MSVSAVNPLIYILLGCPGSGKGTFAQTIKSEGYDHVSTGDITREEVKNETEFGLKYKEAILNHVIGGIPFEEIQRLIEQRLGKAVLEGRGVLLDGYPKTKGQCEFLDEYIQTNALKDKVVVILLDVNEEEAIDRIIYRQTCENCNKIYNSKFSPSKIIDKCDECHGKLNKRLDDQDEVTRKRVYEFKEKMHAVIEHYSTGGRLHVLDGNLDPEICIENYARFHEMMHKGGGR
jgi:adenylate kinase